MSSRSRSRSVRPLVISIAAAQLPVASAGWAQPSAADPALLPPVVVSATRLPTPSEEVASSVTVITAEDIERRQLRGLSDVLRDVPGLSVIQSGGAGAQTSVFMRGANANHTKVMIDGVPANDPSSPNNAFDFGPFLATDIERIEVLRGPQSGLYGSDAIGGVINIVTKKGTGPAKLSASLEGGSFDTFNQYGSLSGSTGRFNYAATIGHFRAGSTPVTPLDLLPPGRARIDDFYENTTFSTKLGAELSEAFGLSLVARYADTTFRATGDDFSTFPSAPAAAQTRTNTRQFVTRGEGRLTLFDGAFEQRLGLGYVDYRRRALGPDTAFAPATPSFARGDRIKLDWLGTVNLTDSHRLLFGLEQETERLRDSPISADNTNRAGFAEFQFGFGDRFFGSLTVRTDDNERFGNVTTYRVAPAYLLRETGTKLKGSVGTGFKAPTLNQLFVSFPEFGFFANPNLKPEESFGWEAGFEQTLLGGRLSFGATYFHNDITDLITSNATFTSLENRPSATVYGAEAFMAVAITDRLSLRGDYTYTHTRDDVTGEELLRRPKHKASASLRWQVSDEAAIALSALHAGNWVDGNRDFSIPRLDASGYTLVSLAGSYALTDNLTAFARVENLFDRRYEEPIGFQRPGIGVYVGVTARLDAARFGPFMKGRSD